jgi:hypothetical protein
MNMRATLSSETKSAILRIKEHYWNRPEYRDTVTSDMIYRAVQTEGARTVADSKRILSRRDLREVAGWGMPKKQTGRR